MIDIGCLCSVVLRLPVISPSFFFCLCLLVCSVCSWTSSGEQCCGRPGAPRVQLVGTQLRPTRRVRQRKQLATVCHRHQRHSVRSGREFTRGQCRTLLQEFSAGRYRRHSTYECTRHDHQPCPPHQRTSAPAHQCSTDGNRCYLGVNLGHTGRTRHCTLASLLTKSCACAHVIHRDQSNCGCCWAFAGASAASDRLCISTNGTVAVPLSAQVISQVDLAFQQAAIVNQGVPRGPPSLLGHHLPLPPPHQHNLCNQLCAHIHVCSHRVHPPSRFALPSCQDVCFNANRNGCGGGAIHTPWS